MAAIPDTCIAPCSARAEWTLVRLQAFINEEVIPSEPIFVQQLAAQRGRFDSMPAVISHLRRRARSQGLWNLFLPVEAVGSAGISTVEYARMAEMMGWSPLAAIACNCSAPDTGNMEVLLEFGTAEQKDTWLTPLLEGTTRSAFLMTEPAVASSDARNIGTSIRATGDNYIINGKKWWATGAANPECTFFLLMGQTNPASDSMHQQSIVLVPKATPGVRITRSLTTFGYDDAPEGHAEVELCDVVVHKSNLIGAEGQGFHIAQSRLGRGRIHHCMRSIGLGERCLKALLQRSTDSTRKPFGKIIAEHATTQVEIAESRIDIDAARLMVMHAAQQIDMVGARGARKHISIIKVIVPRLILRVIDRAIQVHGAAGLSDDFILARAWAGMRTLRIADGPDIVHLRTVSTAYYSVSRTMNVCIIDSRIVQVALLELKEYMRSTTDAKM
jgi:acyl-CoA dehydrogenase